VKRAAFVLVGTYWKLVPRRDLYRVSACPVLLRDTSTRIDHEKRENARHFKCVVDAWLINFN